MNKLVILAGCPGAGKSTFINDNDLSTYTLSSDSIRLMFDSLQMVESGGYRIPQKSDKEVFNTLHYILEERMKKGAFTVIDATHTNQKSFSKYHELCKKYEYELIIVLFELPLNELIARNKTRGFRQVPIDVINTMYENFKQMDYSFAKVVKPENFREEVLMTKPIDLSNFNKVHHIGDIHGCYTVLENILPLKDDEFYIFLGDYFDRGVENGKLALWLLNNYKKPNVVFLHGNHENHLIDYVNNNKIKTNDFKQTITEIEMKGLNSENFKGFIQKLKVFYLYTYEEKTVLCTHGGLTEFPESFCLINPKQYIKGIGSYETRVDEIFKAPKNVYQVHGHRNIYNIDVNTSNQTFNLEGKVEFGGHLCVLTLEKEKGFNVNQYKNEIYKESANINKEMFDSLTVNPLIKTCTFDNITSFNFKRKVFYGNLWTTQTMLARGLFVDNESYEIACRGYEKFFNYGELLVNDENALKNLEFPLTLYRKENGFLGIVGVNKKTDSLIFASKSQINNTYANLLEEILKEQLTASQLEYLKKDLIKMKAGLVFEVIDEVNDPHIIKHEKGRNVVLLDVIHCKYSFQKLKYKEMVHFAKKYNLDYKKPMMKIKDYDQLMKQIEIMNEYDFKHKGYYIEGAVVEDANGFNFKIKSGYYNVWKTIRESIRQDGTYNVDRLKNRYDTKIVEFIVKVIEDWKTNPRTLQELQAYFKQ